MQFLHSEIISSIFFDYNEEIKYFKYMESWKAKKRFCWSLNLDELAQHNIELDVGLKQTL